MLGKILLTGVLLGCAAATPPPEFDRFEARLKPVPAADFPAVQLQLDYVGPKTAVLVSVQCWHQGKFLKTPENTREIRLPLSAEVGLAFGEAKPADGTPEVTVTETTPARSAEGRAASATITRHYAVGALRGRRITTWQPAWPAGAPHGYGAAVWGVFVDEPEGPSPKDPQERAFRSVTGWVFWLRMTDPNLREDEPFPAGTTTFSRLGGRQMRDYGCVVDFGFGTAVVSGPFGWRGPVTVGEQVSMDGRIYKVVAEDNHRTRVARPDEPHIDGFPDRVRVFAVEIDEKTGDTLHRIAVQEFRGEHEKHGSYNLRLEGGKFVFGLDFYTLD